MASYTDNFTGTDGTSPPTGWGGTEGTYWSILSNKLHKTTTESRVVVFQSACATDDTEASIVWDNPQTPGYYHHLGVRCPDNDEAQFNYDCYLAEFAEGGAGTAWTIYRIVNGSVSATLATGTFTGGSAVGMIIRAVNSGGNPVINAWVGGVQRLTNYTDSNAAKITTGKYALVLNFGVADGDTFTFADVGAVSLVQGSFFEFL